MIHGRQVKTVFSTCGYLNGDPALSWVAGQGFNCRVDVAHGGWGFCPTSVIAVSDCGLGGFCFDAGPCSKGPEADDKTDAKFCSIATLIAGPDQTYDYVDCATGPGMVTYFVSPTAALAPPSTKATSSTGAGAVFLNPGVGSSGSTGAPPTPTSSFPLLSGIAGATTDPSVATGGPGSPPGVASNNAEKSEGTPSNIEAIVGGSLGGLALIVGAVVAVVYMLRHRWTKKSESAHTYSYDTSSADSVGVKYLSSGWGPAELAPERPVAELPARYAQSWRN
ncbi:hypothetical protein B0T18DRAFT_339930 [Schizothecium vesticola]|uniref:Uncharacterized protein n=1 Tax=Schizothecium vesticola TaxID=314040 RepID=A0AA40F3W0_9PEZI|nr:hypothetical protein B0T18DRAFT_339930 [Schizothecium vesticola]